MHKVWSLDQQHHITWGLARNGALPQTYGIRNLANSPGDSNACWSFRTTDVHGAMLFKVVSVARQHWHRLHLLELQNLGAHPDLTELQKGLQGTCTHIKVGDRLSFSTGSC